jgi:hypothetical protein
MVEKAIWIGHELIPFGSGACEECGNERLCHLHRIRFADGTEKNVGCQCAARLCSGQEGDIAKAEKKMKRRDRLAKKLYNTEVYMADGSIKKLGELPD